MRILKEVLLPIGLWIYFLFEGVRGGLEIAGKDIEPKVELPPAFAIVLCGLFFFFGVAISLLNFSIEKKLFKGLFLKILGEESYRVVGRRLKPQLLGVVFFALIGTAGLAKARAIGAPEINHAMLQALLVLSLGMLAGWGLFLKRARSRSSSQAPSMDRE